MLGHRKESAMAETVYQAPDRGVDLASARHDNLPTDLRTIEYHSSVAYKADASSAMLTNTTRARVLADPLLSALFEDFAKIDCEVKAELGMFYAEACEVSIKKLNELFT